MNLLLKIMPIIKDLTNGANPGTIIKKLLDADVQKAMATGIHNRVENFEKSEGVKQIIYTMVTQPLIHEGTPVLLKDGKQAYKLWFMAVEILNDGTFGKVVEKKDVDGVMDLFFDVKPVNNTKQLA